MMASKTPGKAMINLGHLEADLHVEAEGEAMPKDNTTISLKMGDSTIITKVEMAKASEGVEMDLQDAEGVGVVPGLLLHVAMANLRVKIAKAAAALMIVGKHSNLCHPPMLEASKAVLTHGTIPMRIKIQTLKEAMEIDKAPNKVMVRADVVEAAAAEVEANLVKTLSTTPATGVMIFPMPTSGTTKSTLDHWQTLRYLRPPEASLNLVRNSGHRNPKVVSNNSNNLLCNNNLNRIVANEASI